jgi:hypothetical protein
MPARLPPVRGRQGRREGLRGRSFYSGVVGMAAVAQAFVSVVLTLEFKG